MNNIYKHFAFIAIFLIFFACRTNTQNLDFLKFKLDGKPISVVDRIICRDNSVITIEFDRNLYRSYGFDLGMGDNIQLECLKNPSNKDFYFEQKPQVIIEKNNEIFRFKIANFKPGSLYSFQMIQIDSSSSNKKIVIRDFIVESREMNSLVINIGVYYSPAHLLNYSLFSETSSKTIIENGPKSSQGIMLGATFFLKGHDEKCFFDNPNVNFIEELCRNIGLYVGVAFSSQNKGIDNILIGGDFAFRSANIILGVNFIKSQYLKNGFNVGDKFTGADLNSAVSSKTIGHLFLGGSVNSSLIISVLGLLTSLAGIK